MKPCQSASPDPRAARLLKGRLLRGANIHHRTTVFVQRIDPGSLRGLRVPDAGESFASRFIERFGQLESLIEGGDCLPHDTRVALATAPGTFLLETLLEAILAVERFTACIIRRLDAPRFSHMVHGSSWVDFVWDAHAAWISRASAQTALVGLTELLPAPLRAGAGTGPDFATSIGKLRKHARRRQWSPATAVIAQAAKRRGIPHELLAGNYLRVGDGVTQQMVSGTAVVTSPERDACLDAYAQRAYASVQDPAADRAGDAVLNLLLPAGVPAAIPTILVVGERGTRSIARSLDRLLRTSRGGVGLTTRHRTTIQGRPIDPTSLGRRHGPAFLLGDPRVAVVIGAMSPRRIVSRGLEVNRSSVTAILDPVPGNDREAYWDAVRVSVEAATDAVVVGADNPDVERVLDIAERGPTLLVTRRQHHPVALRHAANGGGVVFLDPGRRGRSIKLRRGRETVISVSVASPFGKGTGSSGRRIERALYTVALACALGVPEEHLGSVGRVSTGISPRAAGSAAAAGRSLPIRSDVASPDTRRALRLAGNSL